MCNFIRTVFGCHHGVWGRRTVRCAAGKAYRKDKSRKPCTERRPDVKLSRMMQQKCEKCRILDDKIANGRVNMAALKVTIEKLPLEERKRERAMAESEEKDGFGGEDISSASELGLRKMTLVDLIL